MQEIKSCSPGRRASASLTVTAADTAVALGSGDVPVLATARALGLAEQAATQALGSSLPPDKTAVGAWAELEHLSPSPVGETVTAEAVLIGVHGRRLEFSVTLTGDDGRDVAHVRHRRVIVSRSRFTTQAA